MAVYIKRNVNAQNISFKVQFKASSFKPVRHINVYVTATRTTASLKKMISININSTTGIPNPQYL